MKQSKKKISLKTVSKSIPTKPKLTKTFREDVTPTPSAPFIQITVPPQLPLYIFNSLPVPIKTVARILYNTKKYINYDAIQEDFLHNKDILEVHKLFV